MNGPYSVSVNIPIGGFGTAAAGTSIYSAFAMPGTAEIGGGITVTKVWYTTNVVIASGSAPTAALLALTSTGGTVQAVSSTLGSDGWTAGTPVVGTLLNAFVPGTVAYLGFKVGCAANGQTTFMQCGFQYVHGRGNA